MRNLLFLICLIFCLDQSASAQLSAVKGKTFYNFWLNLPDTSILNNNPPILIFLHGKSLSGTDLNRVKKYGVIHEIEKGRNVPAIVIAPQVSNGSWNPDKVLEILEYVQKLYKTDTNRVYVCGMSLGGYGTMHFVGKHADKITAGVALCGGGNPKDACNLASIPMWIQHGNRDEAVPVRYSREMVTAIKNCNNGKNLIYTEIAGANHSALERIFRGDDMYNWLFAQVRTTAGEVVITPAPKKVEVVNSDKVQETILENKPKTIAGSN
ncbi:prolyl oligopeptidase family serine peptidase [Fluviicola taffensis]|uniref:Phospholipase/Carboxylesterase n=1 Tax=Fluviicola taffensis (strain DSM 16823 / NCIMB 13979 / RW262) TaxID=755732 RepID=F2IA67_FLUTR|nr:prolyl oligopeptidase family serine peptidase [Fluviicola taffensis]AEA45244.1 phospholipase/Carboxylesterase [Fluviicola taffensis DSM 16823]